MTDYGHELAFGTFLTRKTGTRRSRYGSRRSPRLPGWTW